MFDWIAARVPCNAPFRLQFHKLYAEVRQNHRTDPFHRTRHYEAVADLRPYGHEVLLHMHNRHGRVGNHKIEVVDAGTKTYAGIISEIENVFEIDTLKLDIMRLDCAADVPGIPVSWFQERMRARHTRLQAVLGSGEFVEMGKSGIQTLYFGKRPNLLRIYDKVAEFKAQYAILRKKFPMISSFEEMFGIPENGYVLTRVERQYGGDRIPEKLATVGALSKAQHFCPFDGLEILTSELAEPLPEHYTFETYLAGMQLRHMAEIAGMQSVVRHISKYGQGNTKRVLSKFRDFLPAEDSNEMVNTDYLNVRFQLSVGRQLAA